MKGRTGQGQPDTRVYLSLKGLLVDLRHLLVTPAMPCMDAEPAVQADFSIDLSHAFLIRSSDTA